MIEKIKKIPNKTRKIILILTAIILIIIAIFSFFINAYFDGAENPANENTAYKMDIIILNLILIPVGLIILYGVRKINNKIYSWVITPLVFIIILAIQIVWVVNLKGVPRADQLIVMNTGINLNDKETMDSMTKPENHLGQYPFQIGFVKYVNIIVNIFKSQNPINLQIMNAIYSTIILLFMYLITRKLFKSDSANKISLFLLLGFSLYFMFFNPHVYGNIIGLMFALIAFYETISYLEDKKVYKVIIIAATITLSIVLKSNYNIFLCGIIVTFLYEILKNKKIRDVLLVISILALYIVGKRGIVSYIEKSANIELHSGIPMISYIYMGMAESSKGLASGWYTQDTIEIFNECNHDVSEASRMSKELIKDRVKYFMGNPADAALYYSDKLGSTWLNPTFQTIWCSKSIAPILTERDSENTNFSKNDKIIESMLAGNLDKLEEIFFSSYQLVIFAFAAYGILKIYKKDDTKHILLPITFLGGFIFHAFWETKAIYVLQYYLLLVPYASYGLSKFFKLVKEKIDLKKK